MLRGSQPATVDAKGRLKIPATFLPELRKYGEEFYVTSESGDFARIYPMKTWEELEAKLAQLPSHNPTKQKFLALTSYYGQAVKMDGQGRVLIPAVLRESAQTTGEMVVLGNQTWLNVWNHSRFLEQHVRSNAWTAEDAKTMGELGI